METTEKLSILLVEDNESDVFFLREALRDRSADVALEVCPRGDLALERLQARHAAEALPDLLVIDLNLPRMTGMELLEHLQADAVLSRLPSIILSSSDANLDVARCYRRGARAYLVKPMNFDHLVEMVVSMVGFWKYVSREGDQPDT